MADGKDFSQQTFDLGHLHRQANAKSRAFACLAFDFDGAFVAADNAKYHGKAQSGAVVPLGREKWLETAVADNFRHARAIVDDLQNGLLADNVAAQLDGPALRHGVDGVKDQIRHHRAEFGGISQDGIQLYQIELQIDEPPIRQSLAFPFWLR